MNATPNQATTTEQQQDSPQQWENYFDDSMEINYPFSDSSSDGSLPSPPGENRPRNPYDWINLMVNDHNRFDQMVDDALATAHDQHGLHEADQISSMPPQQVQSVFATQQREEAAFMGQREGGRLEQRPQGEQQAQAYRDVLPQQTDVTQRPLVANPFNPFHVAPTQSWEQQPPRPFVRDRTLPQPSQQQRAQGDTQVQSSSSGSPNSSQMRSSMENSYGSSGSSPSSGSLAYSGTSPASLTSNFYGHSDEFSPEGLMPETRFARHRPSMQGTSERQQSGGSQLVEDIVQQFVATSQAITLQPRSMLSLKLFWKEMNQDEAEKYSLFQSRPLPDFFINEDHPKGTAYDNSCLLNVMEFYSLPLHARQSFKLTSEYACVDTEVQKIQRNLVNQLDRLQVGHPEFNSRFYRLRRAQAIVRQRKPHFYNGLFLAISLTQLQLRRVLQKLMTLHRVGLLNSAKGSFSHEFVEYLIRFKADQTRLLQAACSVIEEFAFSFFEQFDRFDYFKYIHGKITERKAIEPLLHNPLSLLRQMGKSSEHSLQKDEFVRNVFDVIEQEKRTLLLKKVQIQFGSDSKPGKPCYLKQKHVQQFLSEVLKFRWSLSFQDPSPAALRSLKKKPGKKTKLRKRTLQESTVELNEYEPVAIVPRIPLKNRRIPKFLKNPLPEHIESAFDCIFASQPVHSNEGQTTCETPNVPEVLLEDYIYDSAPSRFCQAEQVAFKMSVDLPHLSHLEQEAMFFVC